MRIQMKDLAALIESVKKIRKLSPNTGNGAAFRQGMQEMSREDMLAFCQAIDTASIAVSAVERGYIETTDK